MDGPAPPGRLVGVELVVASLRLRRPVGTSAGTHLERPTLFVRVATDAAEGWGEAGALPGGTLVDPPLDEVLDRLRQRTVPSLLTASAARGGEVPAAAQVGRLGGTAPADRLALAALELAVLDAELRAAGTSLAARLGVARADVRAGAVVGIPPGRELAALLDEVGQVADAPRVRMKIAPGWDVVPVAAVRDRWPDLALQVDANGAYGALDPDGAADALAALDPYGLTCIEQPLPPADLTASAALAARLATPVCLDESLTSLRRVVDAARYGAMSVACLKPARLGGVFAATRALAHCRSVGVEAFVGGLFEAGPGRAAGLALSALDGASLPGDVSAPASYLEETPCSYPPQRGWSLTPAATPGVGSDTDPGALGPMATARWWYPAAGA